jgi:hypothetical protein
MEAYYQTNSMKPLLPWYANYIKRLQEKVIKEQFPDEQGHKNIQ